MQRALFTFNEWHYLALCRRAAMSNVGSTVEKWSEEGKSTPLLLCWEDGAW